MFLLHMFQKNQRFLRNKTTPFDFFLLKNWSFKINLRLLALINSNNYTMKTKFNGILTLLLAFVVQISFAQTKTVSGTVSDESGGLPGVSVLIKGSLTGSETDFDGKYTIQAKAGDVLVFRFLGYKTVERTVGSAATINVKLVEDANVLEEVVVVGYGTSTKKAFAGTASTVRSEQLEVKSFSNVSQALIGEVAGVTVINGSGQPGSVGAIRIRGYGSVNGNRAPLYVVDGVPFQGSINSINPADIKSTTILKDATATAIYGSRGANGVVVITTKSGSSDKTYIEVDVKTSVNDQIIPRYNVLTNPEEYVGYVWEGLYNRGVASGSADPVAFANGRLLGGNGIGDGYNMWNVNTAGELIDPATRSVRTGVTRKYTPERYADAAFDSALRTEANLRMGGGNADSKYFVSFGLLDDNGYAINTSFKRYTSRINIDSKIKPWLKASANVGYAYSESQNNGQTAGSENVFEFADKMAPIYPVFLRDGNGDKVVDPFFGGYQYDYGFNRPNASTLNPIASALLDYVGSERHEINANFNFDIKFSDSFSFNARYGAQYATSEGISHTNPFYGAASAPNVNGSISLSQNKFLTETFLKMLRFEKSWGKHSVDALVAHENFEYTRDFKNQSKFNMGSPFILELDNFIEASGQPSGFTEGYSIESVFSQANYNYDQKYFLTASIRADGSSRFVNEKWGTFGSVGAAWVASAEDFLSDNSLIKFLKFKASYGTTGDQAGVGFYSGYDTFNVANLAGSVSIAPLGNGNPDLTWELSKQFQFGTEFTLGTFLEGSFDYYNKTTDNLIFQRRVGPSAGIAIVTVNDGELMNSGLEFDLTGHLIRKDNFTLDLSFNGEIIDNEIKTMPIDPATGEPKFLDTSNSPYGWSEGRSIFDFYMREWAGVDPADGAPMWYQYYDDKNGNGIADAGETGFQILENGVNTNQTNSIVEYQRKVPNANIQKQVTKTYANATEVYVNKSAIPAVRGAFRLGGKLHNFNFAAQFTYSIGGWAYDGQYAELMSDRFGAAGNNFHSDIANRWQQPGDITNVPRLADGFDQTAISSSTRFLTKTDYLALNNINIGYTVPSKFLKDTGLDLVNIWMAGDNLFQATARNGFLPTTSETGNSGRRLYAPMSTVTLGVRVRF